MRPRTGQTFIPPFQVQYASQNNLSFLTTGGGHGYTWSLSQLQGGIDIDMSNFDTINIDAAANTMTIGGSVRSNSVTAALQAAGLEIRKLKKNNSPLTQSFVTN